MENVTVLEEMSQFSRWLANNEGLFMHYVVNILVALIIIVVGMMVAKIIANTVSRLLRARRVDDTVNHFLVALLRYTILAFVVIAALGRVGVQTTSLIAVLGAAGLAVGLALQGSLSNFAAGVLIVIFRPFRVGEFIQLGVISGTVDNVQIFSTTLCTVDNKIVIIPNGKIISGEIINFSRHPNRRVDLVISVSYDADIDSVKSVLGDVIAHDKRILPEQEITIRLNEIGASSLNFVVRVWVDNANYWSVYFDLLENIKKALDSHKIRISN